MEIRHGTKNIGDQNIVFIIIEQATKEEQDNAEEILSDFVENTYRSYRECSRLSRHGFNIIVTNNMFDNFCSIGNVSEALLKRLSITNRSVFASIKFIPSIL